MKEKVRERIQDVLAIADDRAVKLLPAHLAFFTVLSLIPLFIIVFFAAQQLALPVQSTLASLLSLLPEGVSDILTPTQSRASGLGVGIWVFVALFSGSNGINSLIIGSNALYGFEPDSYVVQRAKGMVLTFLLIILVLMGIAAIAFVDYVIESIPGSLQAAVTIAQWVLASLLTFAAVKYLYMVTPRKRIASKHTTKGSIVTVSGWVIATLGYSFYLAHFSNYDALYGNLANMIVLMIWVYLLASIFVAGMVVNVSEHRREIARGADAQGEQDPDDRQPSPTSQDEPSA